jgi:hypothetical protein
VLSVIKNFPNNLFTPFLILYRNARTRETLFKFQQFRAYPKQAPEDKQHNPGNPLLKYSPIMFSFNAKEGKYVDSNGKTIWEVMIEHEEERKKRLVSATALTAVICDCKDTSSLEKPYTSETCTSNLTSEAFEQWGLEHSAATTGEKPPGGDHLSAIGGWGLEDEAFAG